jgi:hypothetical protein
MGWTAGVGLGIKGYVDAKKLKLKEDRQFSNEYANQKANLDDSLEGDLARNAAIQDEETSKNLLTFSMEKGGSLDIMMDIIKEQRLSKRAEKENIDVHRSGGAVNIIAKGVLHEDKNSIGDRGIPIVTKDGKKKFAEIEKNEIVFNKDTASEIERLTKMHKDNPEDKEVLKELGNLMKGEILNNTVDKQGELL